MFFLCVFFFILFDSFFLVVLGCSWCLFGVILWDFFWGWFCCFLGVFWLFWGVFHSLFWAFLVVFCVWFLCVFGGGGGGGGWVVLVCF